MSASHRRPRLGAAPRAGDPPCAHGAGDMAASYVALKNTFLDIAEEQDEAHPACGRMRWRARAHARMCGHFELAVSRAVNYWDPGASASPVENTYLGWILHGPEICSTKSRDAARPLFLNICAVVLREQPRVLSASSRGYVLTFFCLNVCEGPPVQERALSDRLSSILRAQWSIHPKHVFATAFCDALGSTI